MFHPFPPLNQVTREGLNLLATGASLTIMTHCLLLYFHLIREMHEYVLLITLLETIREGK